MGGYVGVVGLRQCCQRKVDSCSLIEGSLLYFKLFANDEYNAHSKQAQKTYLVGEKNEEDLTMHLVNRGALVWAGDCLKMFVQ